VVGGLAAANALAGDPLLRPDLLRLAVAMEGHPDNVAPALLGGCQVSVRDGDEVVTSAVPVPTGLRAVLFIPDQPMPTAQARSLLPDRVTRDDAVFNIGRAALLVAALAMGDLDALRVATQDRLHQSYRWVLFPAMRLIIQAALDAGAVGAFLSGAGSTVLALAQGREMTIGFEMADIADKAGVAGEVRVVELSARGAHVVEAG
jgi:homoserine kinase